MEHACFTKGYPRACIGATAPDTSTRVPVQLPVAGPVIISCAMMIHVPPISCHHRHAGRRLAAVLFVGMALLNGCRQAEYQRVAEQRRDKRAAALNWAVNSLAESEKRRPPNLAQVPPYIERDLQRDTAQFEYALEWSAFWLERDAQRVRDRAPVYLDKFGRIMWSRPDDVPTSAIILFY